MEKTNIRRFQFAMLSSQKKYNRGGAETQRRGEDFLFSGQPMAGEADKNVFERGFADGEREDLFGQGFDKHRDKFGSVLFFEADAGIDQLRLDVELFAKG